jgi:diacylglycerol kinase
MRNIPSYNFFHRISLALNGLWIAVKRERHLKFHLLFGMGLLTPLFFLNIPTLQSWILIILITQLIILELINTAIETTVDLITRKFSFRAKLAKDVSSGAVLLSALLVFTFSVFIYGSEMHNLFIGVFIGS